MSGPKRILVLYYSLTNQTELVLKEIIDELVAAGHKIDKRRIQPVDDWTLPLDKKTFYWNWFKIWIGMNLTQPLHHMDLNPDDYDYIILGFQPWNLAPSMPVNSFLDSPMASIFKGKKVIGVVTCRARWERSYRIAKEKIERAGGRLIDGLVIMNSEKEPYNMVTTARYLFHGTDMPPDHPLYKYLRPYGIGEKAIKVAREFGYDLAHRLSDDRLTDTLGWRMVNQPLRTIG